MGRFDAAESPSMNDYIEIKEKMKDAEWLHTLPPNVAFTRWNTFHIFCDYAGPQWDLKLGPGHLSQAATDGKITSEKLGKFIIMPTASAADSLGRARLTNLTELCPPLRPHSPSPLETSVSLAV